MKTWKTWKFEKRKVHSSVKDNTWGADLADTQLISKLNKKFRFYYVIDIYCKYAWVVPLKIKKHITITNNHQNFLNKSTRKPNKVWEGSEGSEGSEVYNRSTKSWLQDNDIEIYSTNNEGNMLLLKDLLEP